MFASQLVGNWNVRGEDTKTDNGTKLWQQGVPPEYWPAECDWYANAATKGMEIWAYSWSIDRCGATNDEATANDHEGLNQCSVFYTSNPAQGCSARMEATFFPTFSWAATAKGHADAVLDGYMYGQLTDASFADPDAAGGITKVSGDRASGVTNNATYTVDLGAISWTGTFKKNDDDADSGAFFTTNARVHGPFTQDTLDVAGYAKVKTYADEEGTIVGTANGEGEAKVYQANPQFTLFLFCEGTKPDQSSCAHQTTAQYVKGT